MAETTNTHNECRGGGNVCTWGERAAVTVRARVEGGNVLTTTTSGRGRKREREVQVCVRGVRVCARTEPARESEREKERGPKDPVMSHATPPPPSHGGGVQNPNEGTRAAGVNLHTRE